MYKFYIIFEVQYKKNNTDTKCIVPIKHRYIVRYDIYNFDFDTTPNILVPVIWACRYSHTSSMKLAWVLHILQYLKGLGPDFILKSVTTAAEWLDTPASKI